jgi:hypothetical protein
LQYCLKDVEQSMYKEYLESKWKKKIYTNAS